MPPIDVVAGNWNGRSVRFRRDRLIVSVLPGLDAGPVLDEVLPVVSLFCGADATMIHRTNRNWAIIKFPAQTGDLIVDLATTLLQRGDLLYAEPDFEGHGHLNPMDTKFLADQMKMWTDVGLDKALDLTKGSLDVRIAVFDSGISISPGSAQADHPEMNGARFIMGHDYVDGDAIPRDEHGHGTHVTGIIAAQGDNMIGIAGINWVSQVYIVRVINKYNQVFPGDVIQAMDDLKQYAVANGWTRVVVNLSLGIPEANSLRQVCTDSDNGTFLLCVGPEALTDTGSELDDPGAYATQFDHVIAVGGTDGYAIKFPGTDSFENITLFAPSMAIVSVAPDYQVYLWNPADPAFDPYPALSGTSQAAAIVSGIASLMWGMNLALTPSQIKHCLIHTADSFVDGGNSGYRVNAMVAVQSAAWTVSLDSAHVTFTDVEVGGAESQRLSFTVASCTVLTFQVVPGSDTGLAAGLSITSRVATFDPDRDGTKLLGVEVTYVAGAAGSVAFGQFKVACIESGDEWNVYITANTVSPLRTAVVLVADKSGSMALASGVGTLTRMQVLDYSAGILVDTLHVGDGLGVVSFEADAALVSGMTDIVGEATTSPERAALKNSVSALAPGSSTSIGDGVVLGDGTVAGAAQPLHALLVLTDGHENTDAFIADVIGSVAAPVYAIGMGTATVIQPASLAALTASTGGYVVLTDTLDDFTRYKVAKYLIQMLAHVSGANLVFDPADYLRPGITVEIPFIINGADREFTALLMMEGSAQVRFVLKTPGGKRIDPAAASSRIRFVPGDHSTYYRVAAPTDRADYVGKWKAVLSIESEKFERVAAALGRSIGPKGIVYQFTVLSESSLRMTARLDAHGTAPGSKVGMSAVITSGSLVLDGANVEAHVAWPDGVTRDLALPSSGRGVYETEFVATQEGVYVCRICARGYTARGELFTREETRTAHIWHASLVPDPERARMREIAMHRE